MNQVSNLQHTAWYICLVKIKNKNTLNHTHSKTELPLTWITKSRYTTPYATPITIKMQSSISFSCAYRQLPTRCVHRLDAAQDVYIYGIWMCGIEVMKPHIYKIQDLIFLWWACAVKGGKRRHWKEKNRRSISTNTFDESGDVYWWS